MRAVPADQDEVGRECFCQLRPQVRLSACCGIQVLCVRLSPTTPNVARQQLISCRIRHDDLDSFLKVLRELPIKFWCHSGSKLGFGPDFGAVSRHGFGPVSGVACPRRLVERRAKVT